MDAYRWPSSRVGIQQGRNATLAQVIETIDRTAPETKPQLAEKIGISEQYLSELLQELKQDGIVQKAYVVDDDAVYAAADTVSTLLSGETDTRTSAQSAERGTAVLDLLRRLDEVTTNQYQAARAKFCGKAPEQPADALEPVTNERYSAVVSELKSYTLTTNWPGNRVASDLATIATNLEIVGDRACFISDVTDRHTAESPGVVEDRVLQIFDAGVRINELFRAVLFEGEATAHKQLHAEEETIHRDLNELFELVTAYSPETYGHLVSVTRALERAIYYWVDATEIAVGLHTGVRPPHAQL